MHEILEHIMKVKAANYKHKKTENIIEQTNQTVRIWNSEPEP